MSTYSFNAFNKNLSDINGKDLLLLKDVSEGWYVDYKQSCIGIKDYAKHISAFANQFGGMLFIGIEESTDGDRKAGVFSGINKSDVPAILLRVREASSAHVNPPIYYEEKVIDGPIDEIGLQHGKSIIIIGIPEGINPPYIHSSGRIYRRQADQSDPKPENDRNALDHLVGKGDAFRESINRFIQPVLEVPDNQKNTTWLTVCLIPKIADVGSQPEVTFDDFKDVFVMLKEVKGVSIPMQSAYTTNAGFFARHVEGNDASLKQLSIKWYASNRIKFSVPLNSYTPENCTLLLGKYKYLNDYLEIASNKKYGNLNFIDLSYALHVIAGLYNQIYTLMKISNIKSEYLFSYSITNTFFKSPFLNTKKFIDTVSKNYIPVIEDKIIQMPTKFYSNNSLLELGDFTDPVGQEGVPDSIPAYYRAMCIYYEIYKAFGLTGDDPVEFLKDVELYEYN